MHRGYRRSRHPEDGHRRLRILAASPPRLSKQRCRELVKVRLRTKAELERCLCLFQARGERHRTQAGEGNVASARRVNLTPGFVAAERRNKFDSHSISRGTV